MKTISTKGIILRRIDYGEADRIITFLTKNTGKTRVIAKGVRKSRSKLAGGVELFSVSEIHVIKGKGSIDTLMSARLIKHYDRIVKDLVRTELAYKFLKQIDKFVEDDAGEEYFDLLDESLSALDLPSIDAILVESSFVMRLLQSLGHLPDFTVNSRGKALDSESNYEFDFEAMSFVVKENGQFNKNHLKVLKLLAHNDPRTVASIKDIASYCSELASLTRGLSSQHL